MKPFLRLCISAVLLAHAALAAGALRDAPELKALSQEFPVLARLLMAEKPWEQAPAELAKEVFSRRPTLAQGSTAYPLLLQDRREAGWPGEKIFDQLSYESEYYCFDRMYPVIRLHVGRPVVFALQHGRVEALAASRRYTAQFPFLKPEVIPPLLARIDQAVQALAPLGARRLPGEHPLVSSYALPNDVLMTVTNLSSSTNGTPYVEIALTPQAPVARFEGTQTLAFPGAEGSGRYAQGGRGGKVYVVTTLEDYLPKGRPGRKNGVRGQASEHARTLGAGNWVPYVDSLGKEHPKEGVPLLPGFPSLPPEEIIQGSLREAVEASGPRTVVFAVSGDIELKDELVVSNPYLTLAGQTAPGAGVQLRNWGIRVAAHDVILRHLRIRVGDTKGPGRLQRVLGEQTHALDLAAMNVIVDHCDIAYANDQVFNIYGDERRVATTLQWSYIYGAPMQSTHEKGNHSMTSVSVGWGFASLHHNLLAHGRVRNPRIDMLNFDFRNNVVYNFEGTGYGSDNDYLRLNYVGNTLKRGPSSKPTPLYAWSEKTRWAQWYGEGNRLPEDFKGVFEGLPEVIVTRPHTMVPVHTHTADESFRHVVAEGGASKPVRDVITRYVAQTVVEGTGCIPAKLRDWPGGGFARYPQAATVPDKNRNGLPDEWEASHGLKGGAKAATGRDLDQRYDNIEVYINSL